MSMISQIPGPDNFHVGGLWALNLDSHRKRLFELNITHVLSVIEFSFIRWGEESKRFKHLSIDIDDDEDTDLLVYFSKAVRFIDSGLYPSSSATRQGHSSADTPGPKDDEETQPSSSHSASASPGGVYVHCAMGKSRSVSCVIAYLLYKYPHRFGGKQFTPSPASTLERRSTAAQAVQRALECVREARAMAGPNSGFMRQLELWWEFGCPADDDGAVERHPAYQKWLYDKMLKEARDMRLAPEAQHIRFEDEVDMGDEEREIVEDQKENKEVRCKKCRRILATPKFLVSHTPTGQPTISRCAHVFIDTLSWMRPSLEDGALDGRLICPNTTCGATVGRFAWQGLKCSCQEWVVPAFSLNRSRVDEVVPRGNPNPAVRVPPGRAGSL